MITFDLHVLGMPLAFVLSQDQTLQFNHVEQFGIMNCSGGLNVFAFETSFRDLRTFDLTYNFKDSIFEIFKSLIFLGQNYLSSPRCPFRRFEAVRR